MLSLIHIFFEDNAQFGYGMAIAVKARRAHMKNVVERLAEKAEFSEPAKAWLDNMDNSECAGKMGDILAASCEGSADEDARYVVENRDMLAKPSMWLFGGDGWAYAVSYTHLDVYKRQSV